MIDKSYTPSRMLGDIFWLKLSWKILKNEVGPINIFDTGCRDGKYAIMLKNFWKCFPTAYIMTGNNGVHAQFQTTD